MSTRDARREDALRRARKDLERLDERAPTLDEPWLTGPEDVERRLREALPRAAPWEDVARAAREREARRARR